MVFVIVFLAWFVLTINFDLFIFYLLHSSVVLFQVDFKIMCENAMIYNKPDTIYHKAARKLLHSGMKILSQVSFEKSFSVLSKLVNVWDDDRSFYV